MRALVFAVAVTVVGCSAGGGAMDAGSVGGGSAGGGAAGGGSAGGGSAGGGSAGGGAGGGAAGGGMADACASDAGLMVASKCSCPGFLLCDGFEAATLDTGTWTVDAQNGTAKIEATRFARGAQALHVNVKASAGAHATVSETKSFPAPGNDFWGRAFMYVDGKAPQVHAGVFEASGPLMNSTAHVRLGFDHGEMAPNYLVESGTEYGVFNSEPKTKVPTGRWACVEWHYAGPTNALSFFMDGAEMTEIAVPASTSPPWKSPAYAAFELGVLLFQNDTATAAAFDVWFDEVALKSTRVGCGG